MLPHRSQKKAPWFHFLHFQGSLKSENQEGKERSTQHSKANQSRCQKVRSGAKFPGCYSRSPAPADSCRPLLVPSPPQGHSPRRGAGAGRGWPHGWEVPQHPHHTSALERRNLEKPVLLCRADCSEWSMEFAGSFAFTGCHTNSCSHLGEVEENSPAERAAAQREPGEPPA